MRTIALHPTDPDWLLVGIELGGVMRSLDAGASWADHNPEAHSDAHRLLTHPLAPERVYEAAGQGIALSEDRGASWNAVEEGLDRRYAWSVFIDWYFTSLALKLDGQVVIDDTQLWTCRTLRDFLDADPAWRRSQTFQRAVVFRKLAEMDVDTVWTQQPYVVARSRPTRVGRARLRARALLHNLRRRR